MSYYQKVVRANQRWQVLTPNISEFAFILGAMKSGTTTLYNYLIQHPDVCRCVRKEPHFWSADQDPTNLDDYYRLWLPKPGRRQIVLEASTSYTKTPICPDVADRLRRLPGRKYFLYLVRDPIDRIESHIAHNIGKGRLTVEEAMSLEDFSTYLAVSNYARQLSSYHAAFPDSPVKLLDFDQLKNDPLTVVREACASLGLDSDNRFCLIQPKNVRKSNHGANQFRLKRETADELRALLADDMRRFHAMSGFDVSRWGFDTA